MPCRAGRRSASSKTEPLTQPPEHILVRLQMWAPAVPFRLNDDRLDDLASIRILDGLHRRPVSQNWDWLIHPVLPVGAAGVLGYGSIFMSLVKRQTGGYEGRA